MAVSYGGGKSFTPYGGVLAARSSFLYSLPQNHGWVSLWKPVPGGFAALFVPFPGGSAPKPAVLKRGVVPDQRGGFPAGAVSCGASGELLRGAGLLWHVGAVKP